VNFEKMADNIKGTEPDLNNNNNNTTICKAPYHVVLLTSLWCLANCHILTAYIPFCCSLKSGGHKERHIFLSTTNASGRICISLSSLHVNNALKRQGSEACVRRTTGWS